MIGIKSNGIASLLIIVLIGSISLIMAYTASLIGLNQLELILIKSGGRKAFLIAETCLEETLFQIHLDSSYGIGAGEINLTLDNLSCIIEIDDLGNNNRRIDIKGINDKYYAKIRAEANIGESIITLNSWEKIPN